jgi:hypothetical protein
MRKYDKSARFCNSSRQLDLFRDHLFEQDFRAVNPAACDFAKCRGVRAATLLALAGLGGANG